mgnify:CR=1 FL=1
MSTRPNCHPLSRRHFLRGAGVALALPWMESFTAFGQTVTASAKPTTNSTAPASAIGSGQANPQLPGAGQGGSRWAAISAS